MLGVSDHTTSSTYNELPSVECADAMLTSAGRTVTLNAFCDLIARHRLESVYGIRLLHNHNCISDEEIMVEQMEWDAAGSACLTTCATHRDKVKVGVYPNSWRTYKDGLTPLEYSADPMVKASSQINADGFLLEFARLAHVRNVAEFIGPTVLPRLFYRDHSPPFPTLLLERSDRLRRANVVRFSSIQHYKTSDLIETIWKATDLEQACSTYCAKAACVPVSVCVKDADQHTQESTHDEGEHTSLHGER